MGRWRWFAGAGIALAVVVVACRSPLDNTTPSSPDAGTPAFDADPQVDAAPVSTDAADADAGTEVPGDGGCNASMPFVRIDSLGNVVNSAALAELLPRLTPDELTLYVTVADGTAWGMRTFTRPSRAGAWALAPDTFPGDRYRRGAWPTASGYIYFSSYKPTEAPYWRIVRMKADGGPLEYPSQVELGAVSNVEVSLSKDESELWFVSSRGGSSYDLYRSVRDASTTEYGEPTTVPQLNTTAEEGASVLSDDGLTIYFASASGRPSGGFSITMATRSRPDASFGDRHVLTDLIALKIQDETAAADKGTAVPGWLSPDQCRLYVSTTRDDSKGDIYVASRR